MKHQIQRLLVPVKQVGKALSVKQKLIIVKRSHV